MEPEGDFNANTKDINAEYNTYMKAQESREDLYIQRTRGYKAQIEEVQSKSAEKRKARKPHPSHQITGSGWPDTITLIPSQKTDLVRISAQT
jgi:hypothetical protein